jgi:hypothetical protein
MLPFRVLQITPVAQLAVVGERPMRAGMITAATPQPICSGPVPRQRHEPGRRSKVVPGFLVAHNESISITDYLTLRESDGGPLSTDGAVCLSFIRAQTQCPHGASLLA